MQPATPLSSMSPLNLRANASASSSRVSWPSNSSGLGTASGAPSQRGGSPNEALTSALLAGAATHAADLDALSAEERAAVLQRMFESLEVIASDLYLHEVVERVVAITMSMLGCERVTIFLADEAQRRLRVLTSVDDLSEVLVE